GEYEWQQWDEIVATVAEYPSLELVLVIYGTPAWARTALAPESETALPDDLMAFNEFTSALATRFADEVDYYQIWDEPNLRDAWGGLDPRPVDYVALLSTGYNAVYSADPTATVIGAALAPTTEQGPHNINEWDYLAEMYAAGAGEVMDAIGAKPYGFVSSPEDRDVDLALLNASRVVRLREIMVENGDPHKAIWASNWGWNSLSNDWQGDPSIWGEVDRATQQAYTTSFLTRAEREWPWMGGAILHHWQPIAEPDDPVWGFSLIDQNGTPNPLLTVLAERPRREHPSNGYYPADNPHTNYSGVWTFGDLGADIGWLDDSRFDFRFSGRDIGIRTRQGDFVAYLYPTVN
ncbi:MAG: hypothetical protein AAF125_27735, partial [Chloroflexota bacterium]